MRMLCLMGVETDCYKNYVFAIASRFAEENDVVVIRLVKTNIQMGLQRRVLFAYFIEAGDFRNDIAGLIEVARFDFVLFRIQIFFFARQRGGFAIFKAAVDISQTRSSCGERSADQKSAATGGLGEIRVDIRGIDEKVWSIKIPCRRRGQLR